MPRSAPPVSAAKSSEVILGLLVHVTYSRLLTHLVGITAVVQGLSAEYNAEIKNRQDNLDVTQAHLRAATRELSEQRKQIQQWQQRCTEVDQVQRQIKNLDEALVDEDRFDWTARTNLDGQDARTTAGDAFRYRGHPSHIKLPPPVTWQNVDSGDGTDAPIPLDNSPEALVRLRRMKMWYDRTESLLGERLKAVQGSDMLKEFQCRKIVAMCTKIPVDQVEQVATALPTEVRRSNYACRCSMTSSWLSRVNPKWLTSAEPQVSCRR
jgi:regulatory protein SWI6